MGLLDYFFKDGNVGLIARQTTAFYEVLDRDFRECFINDTALLAGAGIISSNYYILAGSISVQEVFQAAQNALNQTVTIGSHHRIIDDADDYGEHYSKDHLLLPFIINMEALVFCVDNKSVPVEQILDAVVSGREKIEKNIQEVMRKYKYKKQPYLRTEKTAHAVMINSMNEVHRLLSEAGLLL